MICVHYMEVPLSSQLTNIRKHTYSVITYVSLESSLCPGDMIGAAKTGGGCIALLLQTSILHELVEERGKRKGTNPR